MQISAEYPPDPGGVGDYTRLLSRELIGRGHQVSVLTGMGTGAVPPGDPRRLPVGGAWSWRALPPLLRAIVAARPDIVHIQYQTGAYRMRPAINLLPAILRRLPAHPRIVVTAHDLRMPYLLPKAAPLRRWVQRRLLVDADAVVVTNAADRRRLLGQALPEPDLFLADRPIPATVIPIGSNIAPRPPAGYNRELWRARLGLRGEEIMVAFFGLASPSKGLLELVEALAAAPRIALLLIVGGAAQSTPDRHYIAAVRDTVTRHDLDHRVHWTGYCDPETVSAHLLAADLGALPFRDGASYRRGSLLALLAHGLPLVTTQPTEPLDPPLLDSRHALLVPRDATAELAAALQRLAADETLRARLTEHSRILAQHFTWPAIAAAHEAVYNDVIRKA